MKNKIIILNISRYKNIYLYWLNHCYTENVDIFKMNYISERYKSLFIYNFLIIIYIISSPRYFYRNKVSQKNNAVLPFFFFLFSYTKEKLNSLISIPNWNSLIPASHKIPVPIPVKILTLSAFLIQFLNCTLRQYAKSIAELVRIEKKFKPAV